MVKGTPITGAHRHQRPEVLTRGPLTPRVIREGGAMSLHLSVLSAYVCRGCGTEITTPKSFRKCPVCGISLGNEFRIRSGAIENH